MPDLSVIIPVYNASRYFDECLQSILDQPFRDIELICVDDGSTDQSCDILKSYANRDSRMKVIRQDNSGPSAARNAGLSLVSGRFVAFADSDDIVDPQMYSTMVSLADRYDLDAVGCCFDTFPDVRVSHYEFLTGQILDFKGLIATNKRIFSSNDFSLCWRYLFRRKVIEDFGIRFREDIRFGEDTVFVTEVMAHSEHIYLIDKPLYHYRVGIQDSLVGNKNNPERLTSIPLGYAAKKDQIRRFKMDDYSPCSRDLYEYTIRSYLPMLLNALPAEEGGIILQKGVKTVLSMPMIRESCHAIGFRNIHSSWKEYLFYLFVKFGMAFAVKKLWFR